MEEVKLCCRSKWLTVGTPAKVNYNDYQLTICNVRYFVGSKGVMYKAGHISVHISEICATVTCNLGTFNGYVSNMTKDPYSPSSSQLPV